ncbi:hypothetical protein FNF31_04881 [Cafeteria roenbergensis]|uniref:RanBP2-type domain-containing protein n=1 Tax=Cafeteria roenbergensis TaxID=33653 RepID=A0A5A8D1E9_CAFRO|nr:hypothetical protein FNF31_04881 [Cafeteria roenbergensis]
MAAAPSPLEECRAGCGPDISVVQDPADARRWLVTLADFDDGTPSGKAFAEDLERHARMHGTDGKVHLTVFLPPGFPSSPPTVRMDRPILLTHTGATEGGAFCIPALFKEGWSPAEMRMSAVLSWIKAALARECARVDMHTACAYPVEAFSAAHGRMHSRVSMVELAKGRLSSFDAPFLACPASFAEDVFGDEVHVPRDFEQGNRILVPRAVFAEVSTLMSSRAFVVEVTGHNLVRTYCGVAGSHSIEAHDVPQGDRFVILPNWVASSIRAPAAIEVTVRPVELPKLKFLQILPFSSEFATLDSPKEFLQMALSKHSCITLGETVSFREGERDLSFYVTGMHPAVPAATVWTGDWEAKLNLDILPAQDDTEAATAAGRGPPSLARAALAADPSRGLSWDAPAPPAAAGAAASAASAAGAPAGKARTQGAAAAAAAAAAGAGARLPAGLRPADVGEGESKEADEADGRPRGAVSQEDSNAAFATWRAREMQARDLAAADALRDGVEVNGFAAMAAAGDRTGRIRVRLMPLPLAAEDNPSDVVIRVTEGTTCKQVYATVRARFTPPGVPFFLVRARDGSVVPDGPPTVGSQGIMNNALGQRIIPGDMCDACAREEDEELAKAAAAAAGGRSGGASSSSSSSSSRLELPSSILSLRDDVSALMAEANAAGPPRRWPCSVCTVLNSWPDTTCATCATGQRPAPDSAKILLRETADALQAQYESVKAEYIGSQAGGAKPTRAASGAAAAHGSTSSGARTPALAAAASADFAAWMADPTVDESEDLSSRMRDLRREYQALERDANTRLTSAPGVYHCRNCTARNAWNKLFCSVCYSPRPPPLAARRLNADVAEKKLSEAQREHASILSSQALSLTRSASASSALARAASEGPDSPVRADSAASPGAAASPEELKTFIVYGGTVCLCSRHKCSWLEELYKSQQLRNTDLPLITAETVLSMREAKLL